MKRKKKHRWHMRVQGETTVLCGRSFSLLKPLNHFNYSHYDIERIRNNEGHPYPYDALVGKKDWCQTCVKAFKAGL